MKEENVIRLLPEVLLLALAANIAKHIGGPKDELLTIKNLFRQEKQTDKQTNNSLFLS